MYINYLGGALGIEVTGIDLSQPIEREVSDEIRALFVRHKVVFSPEQNLTKPELIEFSTIFGTPERHHTMLNSDGYSEISLIESGKKHSTTDNIWHSDRSYRKYPPIMHPVVVIHPVSQNKALYISSSNTTSIVELEENESKKVLMLLFDHLLIPEFQIRMRWKKNTVAVWDNRSTTHYAVYDYSGADRKMYRISIQ